MSKESEIRKIEEEVLDLKESPLYEYRTENKYFPVIGEGNYDAEIMFVGEAPGRNEAKTGKPFCGAAGKIFDELLAIAELDRKDIYVTNIVKDRPQKNRDPLPKEIELYAPFLDRQIDIIQPKVIATLGRFSMVYILEKFGLGTDVEPIGKAHGRVYRAKTNFGEIDIIAFYHPAVAIYKRSTIEILKHDFKILKKYKE